MFCTFCRYCAGGFSNIRFSCVFGICSQSQHLSKTPPLIPRRVARPSLQGSRQAPRALGPLSPSAARRTALPRPGNLKMAPGGSMEQAKEPIVVQLSSFWKISKLRTLHQKQLHPHLLKPLSTLLSLEDKEVLLRLSRLRRLQQRPRLEEEEFLHKAWKIWKVWAAVGFFGVYFYLSSFLPEYPPPVVFAFWPC